MSGRGGRFVQWRGGLGIWRGRYGRGRGGNTSTVTSRKKGLCAALGDNILTYNEKGAADQLDITLFQIIKHIGTIYGQEIRNKIHNQTAVIIVKPVYDKELLDKQVIKESRREENFKRIQGARRRKEAISQVDMINDPDLDITLAKLQNNMVEELAKHEDPLEIVLFGDKKAEHEGKWKTYREKQSRLEKHRGQTFSTILEQCLQQLLDQMKQDVIWTTVSTSYDQLQLISIIKKTVLAKTEDQ